MDIRPTTQFNEPWRFVFKACPLRGRLRWRFTHLASAQRYQLTDGSQPNFGIFFIVLCLNGFWRSLEEGLHL